jgi:hypothetical protein
MGFVSKIESRRLRVAVRILVGLVVAYVISAIIFWIIVWGFEASPGGN